ncbi:uncharacterized protein F5891DRAFT_1187468 [Suillus fuscotomentosus]|uniref:Uncharacterized protein n=1 Tax=Suillus fuscotomentosus TaxID=1912939 RepID=A0AAD4E8L3_9AGAM|nr:uncharacterized protein F5891DRAFT_1187468 [Suillus fuscotomentosus]KAG1901597.1 hypothetical protein F5891DRAFT_1187468 [Suillus fuscotomentosus]
MRVFSSENSPNKATDINQSDLDLEEAINEVDTELDHENSISDVEKLTKLDAEQTKVLNDAINHRCKKLREWFRNNTKGKTTPGRTSTSKMLSTLLGQCARGTQDLKEIEVYSQLHYESKVKPLVSDDIKENKLVLPDQKLHAVQQHTSECFAKEPEDVKDEVHNETVHINAARKLGSVAPGQDRTKEEIYRAIQELPIVLGQIFEELSTLTGGWHYSLVMGGPNPLCEGDIMTLSYHHGKTLEGLSFKVSMPNFHEKILLPFERHLGRIYGSSAKGTSVPTSTSSSPPPSTTDLASPSAPSSPPLLTMDLIPTSTLTLSLPPSTTDLAVPTPSPPSTTDLNLLDELPGQPSVPLLPRQEFNTSGQTLNPIPLIRQPEGSTHIHDTDFNIIPQWNQWQHHPNPNPSYTSPHSAPLIDLDSPIMSWRRDYVDGGNTTLSVALPSAAVTQPQVWSPSDYVGDGNTTLSVTLPSAAVMQPQVWSPSNYVDD